MIFVMSLIIICVYERWVYEWWVYKVWFSKLEWVYEEGIGTDSELVYELVWLLLLS